MRPAPSGPDAFPCCEKRNEVVCYLQITAAPIRANLLNRREISMEKINTLIEEIVQLVEEQTGEKLTSSDYLGCVFPNCSAG